MIRKEKVRPVFRDITRSVPLDRLAYDTVPVEIVEEGVAAVLRRESVRLIQDETAVGMTAAQGGGIGRSNRAFPANIRPVARVVRMIGDGLDVVEGPRIKVLSRLTLIAAALGEVVEMRDDAGGDEKIAALVKVDPPGIARAVGIDLELFSHRMKAPDARIDFLALLLGGPGFADLRVGEDTVTSVKPAVGSPGESVQRFVGVLIAPAVEEDLGLAVGDVVLIGVRVEKKVGRRADVDAAEADRDPAGEIDLLGENLAGFESAVTVRVFEDENAVLALVVIAGVAHRIGVPLDYPEAAARVEVHRDGLRDLRFGRDEIYRESRRQLHAGEGILRRETAAVIILRATAGNFPAFRRHFRESVSVSLKMDGESFLAAADDIGTFVSVEIGDFYLDADAGVVVDEMRDKLDLLLRIERVAEPVKDRLSEPARILSLVREVTFAGDEVHASVPVEVREREGVELGKGEAVRVFGRALPHDVVLLKLAGLVLLEPAETVGVGVV